MTIAEDRYRTALDAFSAVADQPTVRAVLHSLRGVLSRSSRLHGAHLYLSGVTQFDSSGVATLIEALKIARANKVELRLQGLQGRLLHLFESTRILSLFDGSVLSAGQREAE